MRGAWFLAVLLLGVLASALLILWRGSGSGLKPLSVVAFESRGSGRLHCFAPQHYKLSSVGQQDVGARARLRDLVPAEIAERLNSDDVYSVVTVIDGKGLYIRYFGYEALAQEPVCW